MRTQLQRELTAAEERSMQEHIYGTTSVLSHPFAPEVPSDSENREDSENAMDDAEQGPDSKRGRRARTLKEEEEDRIAREGYDPHQADSDMESDDPWSQVGPDAEVQRLRRRIKMGKEAAEKFLQPQRMVKPGRGRGRRPETQSATGASSGSGAWTCRTYRAAIRGTREPRRRRVSLPSRRRDHLRGLSTRRHRHQVRLWRQSRTRKPRRRQARPHRERGHQRRAHRASRLQDHLQERHRERAVRRLQLDRQTGGGG